MAETDIWVYNADFSAFFFNKVAPQAQRVRGEKKIGLPSNHPHFPQKGTNVFGSRRAQKDPSSLLHLANSKHIDMTSKMCQGVKQLHCATSVTNKGIIRN